MRATIRLGFLLFCFGGLAGASPNELTNPEFDTTVFPWEGKPQPAWSAVDADDCAGSGSAEIAMPSALLVAGDCIAVDEGDPLFASALVKPETTDAATARLVFAFFVQANCTEKALVAEGLPVAVGPGWTPLAKASTAPAGVASTLLLVAAESGSTQSLFVDRAYAGAQELVFGDTFEAGSRCRWSASTPP